MVGRAKNGMPPPDAETRGCTKDDAGAQDYLRVPRYSAASEVSCKDFISPPPVASTGNSSTAVSEDRRNMDMVQGGNQPRINSQARGLSGTVYVTHAMPPAQYKALSPTTTTVVTPGPQRAFRLPDPRQMPAFHAGGLDEYPHGVGLQLAPSSLYRSYEKGQCGSQRSPYNVMFQPPGYSPQSPLVLPEEVFTYPTGVVTPSRRMEGDVPWEHDRYVRQQYSTRSINFGRVDKFESPELPSLSSPGAWSQPSSLDDDRRRQEYEEDLSPRSYSGVKHDEGMAAVDPTSHEVAEPRQQREARDESVDSSDNRNTGPTNNLSAISDKSSMKSGELGDAYRRLLAGARDGSNSVTGTKPPKTSTWVKETASGPAPKNIPLRRKPCEVPGCRVQPSYGPRGTTRPRFCTGHKTKGMVGLKNRPCLSAGCTTRPHYGLPAGRALFCASHKKEGMVHLFKGAATRKTAEAQRKKASGGSPDASKETDKSKEGGRRGRPTSRAARHQTEEDSSERGNNAVRRVRASARPAAGRGGKDKEGMDMDPSQEERTFPVLRPDSTPIGHTSSASLRMSGLSPADTKGEKGQYYSSSHLHRTENIPEGTNNYYRREEMGWGEQPSREDDQAAVSARAAWRKKRGFRDTFSARMIQVETLQPSPKAARTTTGGGSTNSQRMRESAM